MSGGRRWPDDTAWFALAEHVAEALDVGPGTSVFDVECGDGGFLRPLLENGYVVGGLDRSTAAVDRARAAMPSGWFAVGSPAELNPADAWQVVVASQGLSGVVAVDEARGVLARMAAKATHAVVLLHVPDDDARAPGLTRTNILRTFVGLGLRAVQIEAAAEGRFHVFVRV